MTAPMGTLGIALPALAAGAYFANVQACLCRCALNLLMICV